jgi:hypothetical protein
MSDSKGAGPGQTFRVETKRMEEAAPYVESQPVGEIVVDGLANVMLAGGLLRLTLFVERADVASGGAQTRPVVCRLALTPTAAHGLSVTIRAVLDNMVAAGVIPVPPPIEQSE